MKNIGIYPGSFDPITLGHIDIIEKALNVCDEVHVVVAQNKDKKHMFSIEDRVSIVRESLKELNIPTNKKIRVILFEGILSSYANNIKENPIMIRGIRNHIDLDYEQNLEQFTKNTSNAITMYFTAEKENMFTSSSLVRNFIVTGNIEVCKKYMSLSGYKALENIVFEQREQFEKKFSTTAKLVTTFS